MNASATESGIKAAAREGMDFLENGFHILPKGVFEGSFPSMHRARMMVGMAAGWELGNYLGNIMAAQDLLNNPIAREDVPPPLRFLHGILEYNGFSDDSHDRILRLTHQMMGGVLGGIGAVKGSMHHFNVTGDVGKVRDYMAKTEGLSILQADHAASAAQAGVWRPLAGMLGAFSSSSGFAVIPWLNFSTAINSSFSAMGNRKPGTQFFSGTPLRKISNTATKIALGPSAAAERLIRHLAYDTEEASTELREQVAAMLKPLFPRVTDGDLEKVLDNLRKVVRETRKNTATAKEVEEMLHVALDTSEYETLQQKAVRQYLRPTTQIGNALRKHLHAKNFGDLLKGTTLESFDPKEAHLGDHGWLTDFTRSVSKALGDIFGVDHAMSEMEAKIRGETPPPEPSGHAGKILAGTALAAGAGGTAWAAVGEHGRSGAVDVNVDTGHAPRAEGHLFYHPLAKDVTNISDSKAMETMIWLGDAMQQVAPLNRLVSALALVGGLGAGAAVSVAASGKDYHFHPVAKEALPKMLQPLHGVLKYDYFQHDFASRSKRFATHYAIPAVMGGAAVWGASKLYYWAKHRNDPANDPKYLEDYATAAVRAQAKPWGVLSAVTSLFPSASGSSFLPFNYGVAVNTQSTMEGGHRIMMPGLGKVLSNNHSHMEGGTADVQKFLVRYAAENPSLHPARLEDIWGALILPLYPKATPEQLQRLVDKTHTLRDPYMRRMMDGEDPKTVRKEMAVTFTRNFTKEGFLQLLTEVGLDPAKADFVNNGLFGKVGDVLGAGGKVSRLQKDYADTVHAWQSARSASTDDADTGAKNTPTPHVTHAEHLAQQTQKQAALSC